MINGSCHCHKVQFEINTNRLTVRYCYCETCRKLSGADYSCVARVDRNQFNIIQGEKSLSIYSSKPGKKRFYCSVCFSPIYVITDEEQNFLRVRLGLLDGKPDVEVTGHMWVSEKPEWRKIDDSLPVFNEGFTGEGSKEF